MKNNRLCAGLALLLCMVTISVWVQSGANSTAPDGAWLLLGGAVCRGDIATVRALLAADVDVNAVDNNRRTALHLAVANGREAFAAAAYCGRTPLHWAADYGHEVIVQLLLGAGANVDGAYGSERETALHRAAQSGHEAIVWLLLVEGANVGATNCRGETPLHRAAGHGHDAVVRILLEAGANVDATERNGGTVLHWAAGNGHTTVVRLLLDAGASIGAMGYEGETPLHWAAGHGYDAVVRILFAAGANVDATNDRGETPLYRAAMYGRDAVVRWLAVCGATPLTRAACERLISNAYAGCTQRVQTNLERLHPLAEQASLERKHAIESTLDEVRVQSARLPRDLKALIISMSEHPDVLEWWRQADRLRAVSCMRLPDELLERIVTFDSPQDIGPFRGMLE